MAYSERPPPPALRGVAECAWTVVPDQGDRRAVLPDGCMDLIWTGDALLIAGPDTVPQHAGQAAGHVAAGIRFAPGALPAMLGVPAHALRDQRVPLAELHPAQAGAVTVALEGGEPALPLLLDLALRLPGGPPDRTVAALVAGLARVPATHRITPTSRGPRPGAPRFGPDPSAAAMADALGVTTRTLHRRCLDAFGYGPAVLRRVLRFRRAVDLLYAGAAIADVAARAGYADQPHLSREVRALAGVSPGQLVASGANRSTPLPSGSSTTA